MSKKKGYSQGVEYPIPYLLRLKEELKQRSDLRIIEPLGQNPSFIIRLKEQVSRNGGYWPTVWVVSPGGSGSSLLYDNLAPACTYSTLKSHSYYVKWKGKDCIMGAEDGGFMWGIKEDDKIIYLYAHPLNILLSFYNKVEDNPDSWTNGFHHYVELLCNTDESFMDMYLHKDILNLERHLDCWWRQRDFDILCVKYEHLHEHVDDIARFIEGSGRCEINFQLPPYKKRTTDWRIHPQKELLLKTYASVIEKYEQKSSCELLRGTNKHVFL